MTVAHMTFDIVLIVASLNTQAISTAIRLSMVSMLRLF
jgi:hypothetical protein